MTSRLDIDASGMTSHNQRALTVCASLAQLHADMAHCYETSLSNVFGEEVAILLEVNLEEHQLQMRALCYLISHLTAQNQNSIGVPQSDSRPIGSSQFPNDLAMMTEAVGAKAALVTLQSNERMVMEIYHLINLTSLPDDVANVISLQRTQALKRLVRLEQALQCSSLRSHEIPFVKRRPYSLEARC